MQKQYSQLQVQFNASLWTIGALTFLIVALFIVGFCIYKKKGCKRKNKSQSTDKPTDQYKYDISNESFVSDSPSYPILLKGKGMDKMHPIDLVHLFY